MNLQFVSFLVDHLQSLEGDVLQLWLRIIGEILILHVVQMFELILKLFQKNGLFLFSHLLHLLVGLLLAEDLVEFHRHSTLLSSLHVMYNLISIMET